MNITEIAIFVGLATLIIVTQVGRHTFTLYRLILPVVASALVGRQYLQGISTVGGDLDFALICAAFGATCGLLAATMVRVERDATTGKIITWAGVGYALVWIIVLGGRLAFAYAAQHGLSAQVGQFSIDHALTASGWTTAFVLMALAMVLVRTATIGARALLATNDRSRQSVLARRTAA